MRTTDHRPQTTVRRKNSLPKFSNILTCCLMAVVCSLMTGCIYRKLTIKTDPPGALVYLNDRLIGETPVAHHFVWYGWYRVTVRKSGYERIEDRRKLKAPFYLWLPFDLVMEVMPFPVTDAHTWSYILNPVSESAPIPTPEFIEPPSDK